MKKLVLVLAVMFLFLLVVGAIAQDIQKQDYTKLIIGVWEWEGIVDG